jgi:hypothetical protein
MLARASIAFTAMLGFAEGLQRPKEKLQQELFTLKELDGPYPEKLTVHMVHHTHDDVGWLKTVDEYWSGVNDDIQRVGVNLILDEVMRELLLDPKKKFSYVEMKFFTMWWDRQTDFMKESVR